MLPNLFKPIVFFLLAIVLAAVNPVFAQDQTIQPVTKIRPATAVKPSVTAEQPIKPEAPATGPATWAGILDTTTQALSREGVTDQDLDKLFKEAGRVRDEAAAEIQRLQPIVDQAQQQLDELGKEPGEGEPEEAVEVKERRKVLKEDFAKLDAELKQAKLSHVRSQQIQKTIAGQRHDRFFSSITKRTTGLTVSEFWPRFFVGFQGFYKSFKLLFTDSFAVFVKQISENVWKQFALPFLLLLTGLAFFRGRRFFTDLGTPPGPESENSESELRQAAAGFLKFCRDGILTALLPVVVYFIFSGLGLLTPRLEQLFLNIALSLAFVWTSIVLIDVFLAPKNREQRIFSLNDGPAHRVFNIMATGLLLATIVATLNQISVALVSPLEVNVGLSLIFCLLLSIAFIISLVVIRKDQAARMELHGTLPPMGFWRYSNWVAWLVSGSILVAAIAGYIAFAEFLAQQLVFGLVVVFSAWLLLRYVDHVFVKLSEPGPAELVKEDGPAAPSGPGQAVILGTGIAKLLIYMFAFILLMLPWGYRTSDFYQIFNNAFFGFEVGGLRISLSTVLFGLGLFVIGYMVTAGLRKWLNTRLLPTTKLDTGVSNSISTVFGYVGFSLAALLAVTAAGFDLSSLALVAGALTVGIGFGLQSITSNFVSGLILLAERPIKAGDWIVTTGGEGTVKRISVRSTEIETFDHATIIVPNSTLITDTVTNWTHGTKSGRLKLAVGVGYGSDPEQVRDILLKCAADHRLILGRPAPLVMFMDFGADSLNFELRCYLGDINNLLGVQSDLRYAVLKELRAANIEIPFPQRDIHIKSDVRQEVPVKRRATRQKLPRSKS